MGDTDRTPDGSGAFDFLGSGTPNIRKAAAYTYQALLDLASQRLGVPKSELSVKDGVVSGGGKSISYGDLVKGQQLKLTIPVSGNLTSIMGLTIEGNPPMKPVSEYTIIGKSFRNSVTTSKVAARENGPPMCGCPACCTRAWCIRRRWARRSSPPANWTRPAFRTRRWS
jgi:nicotinate dehydrogenase subunit B